MPKDLNRRQGPKAASGLKEQQVVTKGSLGSHRIGRPDNLNDLAANWFIVGVRTDLKNREIARFCLSCHPSYVSDRLTHLKSAGLHSRSIGDAGLRALLGRLAIVGEVARGIDQREVRKGLRKITDQAARARLILLAQQPEVVA